MASSSSKAFLQFSASQAAAAASSTQDRLSQTIAPGLLELSAKQLEILEKVHRIHREPITTEPIYQRAPHKVAASKNMHKRINPGFVDMPYYSSNELAFKYQPPPDFTRDYLKSKSDCDFQGYAAEAILKHVDLNKTSH